MGLRTFMQSIYQILTVVEFTIVSHHYMFLRGKGGEILSHSTVLFFLKTSRGTQDTVKIGRSLLMGSRLAVTGDDGQHRGQAGQSTFTWGEVVADDILVQTAPP
jgi:hypothetical protein